MKIFALALGKIGKFNSFSVTGVLFYIHVYCHSIGSTKMAEYERGRGYSSLEDVSGSPNLSFDEQPQMAKVSLLERILTWRKYLILVLAPILLMPIAIAIEGTVSLESL